MCAMSRGSISERSPHFVAAIAVRAAAALLCVLLTSPAASAYRVLAHEANIDALWDTSLRPLLARRFPRATRDELARRAPTPTAAR